MSEIIGASIDIVLDEFMDNIGVIAAQVSVDDVFVKDPAVVIVKSPSVLLRRFGEFSAYDRTTPYLFKEKLCDRSEFLHFLLFNS